MEEYDSGTILQAIKEQIPSPYKEHFRIAGNKAVCSLKRRHLVLRAAQAIGCPVFESPEETNKAVSILHRKKNKKNNKKPRGQACSRLNRDRVIMPTTTACSPGSSTVCKSPSYAFESTVVSRHDEEAKTIKRTQGAMSMRPTSTWNASPHDECGVPSYPHLDKVSTMLRPVTMPTTAVSTHAVASCFSLLPVLPPAFTATARSLSSRPPRTTVASVSSSSKPVARTSTPTATLPTMLLLAQ